MELHCKSQIEAFKKLNCIKTYDYNDNNCGFSNDSVEGMLIGYFTKHISIDKLAQSFQNSSHYLIENACTDDLEILQKNSMEVLEIAKPDWYLKYLDNDNVYILQVIVVEKSLRGTRIFRKLISPILEEVEKQNIPVVLKTHIYENIAKFEHFGFKLMEEVRSDKMDLSCYNMMKKISYYDINI